MVFLPYRATTGNEDQVCGVIGGKGRREVAGIVWNDYHCGNLSTIALNQGLQHGTVGIADSVRRWF